MANAEVGTIGTMYECRKNGKIGVLESRDEKYKTLLLRDKNGDSFNITFSTFKSNWRKYTGEEKIETSGQTTEKKQTVEKKAEKASQSLDETKPVKRKSKKESLIDRATKQGIAKDLEAIVANSISQLELSDNLTTRLNVKGGVTIRKGRKTVFEVWPDCTANPIENVKFHMRKELWDEVVFSKKVGDITADYHEKWIMQYSAIIPKDVFELATSDLLKAVKEVYLADEKEEE